MRKIVQIQLLVGALVFLTACPPTKPSERRGAQGAQSGERAQATGKHSEEDMLAEVNGEALKRGEFERRLEGLPEYARARYRATERKQTWLNSQVQFELLADVAEQKGLGQRPEVLDAMKAVVAEHTLREAIRTRLSAEDISEGAVERAYRAEIDRYRRPERRRVAVIAVESRDWAAVLRDKLLETSAGRARINQFRKLASDISLLEGADEKGGDFGWLEPPEHAPEHPAVARAVFELEERGDIAGPFQLEHGPGQGAEEGRWWLATWYDRQAAEERSLDEVSRQIRQRLYEEKRAALKEQILKRWRDELGVEIDEERLEALQAPQPERLTRPEQITLETRHDID